MAWDINEIKTKIIYLEKIYKKTTTFEEKETIAFSLKSLQSINNYKTTIKKKHLNDYINYLSLYVNDISNPIDDEIIKMALPQTKVLIDIKYLETMYQSFIEMFSNKKYVSFTANALKSKKFSENDLVFIAKEFYKDLDNDLYNQSLISLDNKNRALNFFNINNKEIPIKNFGVAFYDHYFNKAYCGINYSNNYMDMLTTVHEVMHANDFGYNKTILYKKYPILDEIAPKTIEYLFLDYLDEHGFDADQVEKIRKTRTYYGMLSAHKSYKLISLKNKSQELNNLNSFSKDEIGMMMNTLSSLVAYYLYSEIKLDKEIGLDKLKNLMKNPILIDQKPSFDFIGLDSDKMLETAKAYGMDSERIAIKDRIMIKKKI